MMPTVEYMTVTGLWSHIIDDGIVDGDPNPDVVHPTGKVVFAPKLPAGFVVGGSPAENVTIAELPALIAGGILTDLQGNTGVKLPKSVDGTPIRWVAKPDVRYGKQTLPSKSVTFDPPTTGDTLHLNDVFDDIGDVSPLVTSQVKTYRDEARDARDAAQQILDDVEAGAVPDSAIASKITTTGTNTRAAVDARADARIGAANLLSKTVADATYAKNPVRKKGWIDRLAQFDTRRVNIVSIGDSWTTPEYGSRAWHSLVAHNLGTSPVSGTLAGWTALLPGRSTKTGTVVTHEDDLDSGVQFQPGVAELTRVDGADGDGHVSWSIYDATTVDVLFWVIDGYFKQPQYAINGGARQDFATVIDLGGRSKLGRISGWEGGTLDLYPSTSGNSMISLVLPSTGWTVDKGVRWIDFAYPGWTAAQWKGTVGHWSFWPDVLACNPDLIHIGLGGNDAIQQVGVSTFRQNLRDIVTGLRANVPATPLMFTTMPFPDQSAASLSINQVLFESYMQGVRDVAAEYPEEAILCDWATAFGTQSESPNLWISGDYHPTQAGEYVLAALTSRALSL